MCAAQVAIPATTGLLPDPARRTRRFTVVSVDDHLVEPPDVFEGRMPARFAEQAPRVVDIDGGQAWSFDGQLVPNIGANAVAGRPLSDAEFEPRRFEDMRRGAWDVHARIRDMDLDGVYASLNFPSFLVGFGGGRIQTLTEERELAFAAVRAVNSWHLEDWAGAYPDRLIPCQIPWLHDPTVAAREIEKNAARGFRAMTFPESPERLGFPSVHTGHWDPLFAACAETGTVLCLHVGSAGSLPVVNPDAPIQAAGPLFGVWACMTAIDWLYSMVPARFPDLRICLSEGGIGWITGLYDRLDHCNRYLEYGSWAGQELTPREMMQRNFWFCALDDPTAFTALDRIGSEHIMFEVDYPHADTSWPDTQSLLAGQLAGLSAADVDRVTWRNASELFGHAVPEHVRADPDSF